MIEAQKSFFSKKKLEQDIDVPNKKGDKNVLDEPLEG